MIKVLMQGLYYPAVLGAGVVYLFAKVASHTSIAEGFGDLSNYFAVLLLAYFSISFLINDSLADDKYNLGTFICDMIEIILIFSCLFFLRVTEPAVPSAIDFRNFYYNLAVIPIVQQLWNVSIGNTRAALWILAILAVGLFLTGGLWGYRHFGFNIAAIGGLIVLFGAYITLLRK